MKDVFKVWQETRNVMTVYDAAIEKYEGEVKGFGIMIRREELSEHSDYVKRKLIAAWKKDLRKARTNLTKVKKLREQSL